MLFILQWCKLKYAEMTIVLEKKMYLVTSHLPLSCSKYVARSPGRALICAEFICLEALQAKFSPYKARLPDFWAGCTRIRGG